MIYFEYTSLAVFAVIAVKYVHVVFIKGRGESG